MSNGALHPDTGAINRHLRLLSADVASSAGLKFELAWGLPEQGPCHAKCFNLYELSAAAAFAAMVNTQGCNVYLGVTLKAGTAPAERRTSNRHAALATVLAVDIDTDLVGSARRLPSELRPRLITVTGRQPTTRGHLWFRLSPTSDLDLFDEAVQRAVDVCGGDAAARGRARVMRLAGTISYPSEAKVRRGYMPEVVAAHFVAGAAYDVRDILKILPPAVSAVTLNATAVVRSKQFAQVADVLSALHSLPSRYADDYDLWVRVGLALHNFDPSLSGLDAWKRFSALCPEKAQETDFEKRWSSFGQRSARPLTVRWLFAEAHKHGWLRRQPLPRSSGV